MSTLLHWCDFCYAAVAHGDIGQTPAFQRVAKNASPSRVVYESERFIAIAGLGQIIDGYILLLTKEHFYSMAHLPSAYFEELEVIYEYIVFMLSKLYTRPIIFEHGPMPKKETLICEGGGSCMDHAHLHFFPLPTLTHDILLRLQCQHAHFSIHYLEQLGIQKGRQMPYLFFETVQGHRWVFDAPSVPSQYIRRYVAEVIGKPERWNWHVYPEYERIYATVQRFKNQK